MLIGMICCLLLLVAGIVVALKCDGPYPRVACVGGIAAIPGGLVLFVLTILYFIPKISDGVSLVCEERPLRAVRMDKSQGDSSGSFFLGCGSIASDGSRRYFWWYEQRDETVAYCQAWCDNSLLIEAEGDPKVVWHFSDLKWTWMDGYVRYLAPARYIKLYIPKGSILEAWEVQ
jgi:hypothetical protein